ncbi:outer membrane beta-barrel protein [Hoeflea olei]|uniref:Outer membrane protein beta-barrel domain-containing protein n=1 Tax=Hoeflea olei TaxID=1480615 RepID=A0A1C1Z0W0_9HYPH|nr:outer membrane beta-barrel protein [Hoeflea olei]OCW59365.1 hypothetical protein AWJ14_10015 [Hoeflea olei]
MRGTTSQPSDAASRAAATLYGALPAPATRPSPIPRDPAAAAASSGASARTIATEPTTAGDQTGSIGPVSDLSQADRDYAESLGRQNERTGTVDGLRRIPSTGADTVPGFMLGTLTLRPTIGERVVHESVDYGSSKTSRVYSETTVSGTLQSDWSRHQLTVDGAASFQKNLSGTGTEEPRANIDARLDLDLVNDVTATLGAGYSYSEESRTDPNAIAGATAQSGIHEFRSSVGLRKDLGLLRGTTTFEVTRRLYGDATSASGAPISVDDRDTLGAELTARVGYALSPALIPFLEASVGREKYDQRIDNTGAERSSITYGVRAGAEFDMGEKLRGELAAGYVLRDIDDSSLEDLSGLTLDGSLAWSPRRGTDLSAGLTTRLESATAAGQSGSVVYGFNTTLTQQIHSSVVARLGATAGLRDYDQASGRADQKSYGVSTGLVWSINRYLDLEADASYTRTREPGVTDEKTARVALGLKLRR